MGTNLLVKEGNDNTSMHRKLLGGGLVHRKLSERGKRREREEERYERETERQRQRQRETDREREGEVERQRQTQGREEGRKAKEFQIKLSLARDRAGTLVQMHVSPTHGPLLPYTIEERDAALSVLCFLQP